MCGIAGFINFSNAESLVRQAHTLQAHRGPDFHGSWINDNVVLIHQRLSIIDLSERSNQPFRKNGLTMIFNGEIYNYQDIQQKLIRERNVEFITSGDTEVVMEAYRAWGVKCFDHFIGMFAFALYDEEKRYLLLARDHFGIKPLYYTHHNNQFAFSSELKTLLKLGAVNKTVHTFSLLASLNYLWIPGNESIVQGIKKVPPGHYLEISAAENPITPKITPYWKLKASESDRSEAQTVEELRSVLADSIKRHMVADVPVSSFLSGGLDSSLISVLASHHNKKLSTYTIGTRSQDKLVEKMPDDEKYANLLAHKHNFDHHNIVISPDIIEDFPRMVKLLDEPIGDPAAINTYLICKQAREQGVKVLLSGMGADELFFGYRRQLATLYAARYKKIPALLRKPVEIAGRLAPVKINNSGFKTGRWLKRFLSFANLPIEQAYRRSYSYYDDSDYNRLLIGDYHNELRTLNEQHHQFFYEHPDFDLENKMCYTDINMFMVGLNLAYSDRASMAASVEVRVPFIDKKVVEYAMTIPGKLKYRKGESKYILKKAAESYLPEEIIYRPKASFGAPIRSWISNDLRGMVDDLLSEERIKKRGIFQYAFVKKLIDDDRKGIQDNAYQIYQLLTLELWFNEFLG
ncbi:MAG: asparagine synthase (glutamine-hydrolyzing) [Bacteroidota bacterium]